MGPFFTATAAASVFDVRLLPEQHGDVNVFTTDAMLLVFFPGLFYQRWERVHSPTNLVFSCNKLSQNLYILQDTQLYSTIGSYLLRIEKEKRHFFRKQANATKEYHCIIPGKYVNLYQNTQFPRLLWVCPLVIIQNTSISHAKRQIFNRALNFISAPHLFTIHNTSNSPSKTHLRTSFLQNSSQ